MYKNYINSRIDYLFDLIDINNIKQLKEDRISNSLYLLNHINNKLDHLKEDFLNEVVYNFVFDKKDLIKNSLIDDQEYLISYIDNISINEDSIKYQEDKISDFDLLKLDFYAKLSIIEDREYIISESKDIINDILQNKNRDFKYFNLKSFEDQEDFYESLSYWYLLVIFDYEDLKECRYQDIDPYIRITDSDNIGRYYNSFDQICFNAPIIDRLNFEY